MMSMMKRIGLFFLFMTLFPFSSLTESAVEVNQNILTNIGVKNSDVDEKSTDQHLSDSRKEKIEGKNQVIFTDTSEIRDEYIPQTGWREKGKSIPDEECTFAFVMADQSFQTEDVIHFFEGQNNRKTQRFSESIEGTNDSDVLKADEELVFNPGQAVLIELNGSHWIHEIEVNLENDSRLEVAVSDGKQNKSFYKKLFSREENKIELDSDRLCTYIRLKCPEKSTKPVILKGLTIVGRPTIVEHVLRETDDPEQEILDEKDEVNPLSIHRTPIKKSVYSLAEELLSGQKELSYHQTVMVFMDYISDFYIGTDDGKNYLSLNSYIGACGTYSNILAALASTQGFQARIITLGNYPASNGHTVCEIYYDEKWHLYDPTYGSFYTTTPENTVSPCVLGFDDLAEGKGNRSNVFCIVTTPERLTGDASYSFLGPRIYEEANPKGVCGPANPHTYPLSLSVTEEKIDQKGFDSKHQGISYIGAAYINTSQLWQMKELEVGKKYEFVVRAEQLGGDKSEPFIAVAIPIDATISLSSSHAFDANDPSSMTWIIEFIPKSTSSKILLTHNYNGPEYRYVRMASFELHEKK